MRPSALLQDTPRATGYAVQEQARPRNTGRAARTIIPYIAFLACSYLVFSVTVDDPFITFRYAANWVAGHGVVFNVGERVEGFTSPLHLVLIALLLKLAPPVDILFKAKLASLFFGLLTLWQTGRLARRAGLKDDWALLAQTLVALNMDFALSAVNALETSLYAFLVTAALSSFLRECHRRGGFASTVLLFLSLLARPEAILLFVALLGVRLAVARRMNLPFAFTLRWALLFGVLVAAMCGTRFAYYGTLLPNTYFAKHSDWISCLVLGMNYLKRPLPGLQHRLVLFAPCFWGLALLGFWRVRRRVEGQAMGAVVLAAVLFILRAGGDWMEGWRFMIAVLPALALFQCWGIQGVIGLLRRKLTRRPARTLAVGFCLAVWSTVVLVFPHESWWQAGFSTRATDLLIAGNTMGRRWVEVSDFFQDRLPPGATVAYSEMGYASYANMDKPFLDTRGLTDHDIAMFPNRYKYDVGVIDGDWYEPNDPMFRFLTRHHPAAIISLEYPPNTGNIMAGYHLVAAIGTAGDNSFNTHPTHVYLADSSQLRLVSPPSRPDSDAAPPRPSSGTRPVVAPRHATLSLG